MASFELLPLTYSSSHSFCTTSHRYCIASTYVGFNPCPVHTIPAPWNTLVVLVLLTRPLPLPSPTPPSHASTRTGVPFSYSARLLLFLLVFPLLACLLFVSSRVSVTTAYILALPSFILSFPSSSITRPTPLGSSPAPRLPLSLSPPHLHNSLALHSFGAD